MTPTRKQRRDALVDKHTASVAKTLSSRLPSARNLLDAYTGGNSIEESQAYIRDEFDPENESTADAVAEGQRDGFLDGWSEFDIEEKPDDAPGTRLGRLLEDHPVIVRTLETGFIIAVASALLGGTESGIDDASDESARSMWDLEMTACITAGTQQGCEVSGTSKVRLEVAGGECDFCAGYDGRIMDYDHDEGMPPLHRGCSCGIEPLKE